MNAQHKEGMKVAEQAAQWLVRLEQEQGSEVQAQFVAWLKHSPRHMEEFLITAAVYDDFNGVDSQRRINVAELVARRGAQVVPLQGIDSASPKLPMQGAKRGSISHRWLQHKKAIAGLAAGAALLLIGASISIRSGYFAGESYRTSVGEQRSVRLTDGSVIYLNTQSTVDVRFSERKRDVTMIDGEALFVVAHDSARPFRVRTDSAVIQAVGTQFNVYERGEATTVSVVEGKVRVMPEDRTDLASPQSTQLIAAGEEVKVSRTDVVKQKAPDLSRAVAWRQRQFVFSSDTLEYVLEQVNRYNRVQIRLADPLLAQRRLSGIFNVDDLDSLLEFLNEDGALTFERSGDELVVRKGSN